MALYYSGKICKRIGASIHREGGKAELRVPLTKSRVAIIDRIARVTGEGDSLLAGEAAHMALNWIDGFIDPDEEFAPHFLMEPDYERDYDKILTLLTKFECIGWIESHWKRIILDEIRERLANNDIEPISVEWHKEVLAKWSESEPAEPAEAAA